MARNLFPIPRKDKEKMIPKGLTRMIAKRPSRLLPKPVPLTLLGEWMITPYDDRWQTIEWNGPEKISGEWWGDSFSRTYYQVTALTGERLWVYQEPNEKFFLHGYFD
jgi:hypothetical protein